MGQAVKETGPKAFVNAAYLAISAIGSRICVNK